MEVTALCIRLLMNVLFLLPALHHKVDSVSLQVIPNKQQFFEYESLMFHCEGFSDSTGLKFVHKIKGELQSCKTGSKLTSTGLTCTQTNLYPEDSGVYWCEDGRGKRSNSINITVTAGSVILESPVLPVMEGDVVTLRCRNKTSHSTLTVDFYKDGLLISNSSTGWMIIPSVSRSDEGLYKCRISDGGESAQSLLTVREAHNKPGPCASCSPTTWIIVTVLLMVLLSMVGLLHIGKCPRHRVPVESCAADSATYAVVRKSKKTKGDVVSTPIYSTIDKVETQQPGTKPPLTVGDVYSTIQLVAE